MSALQDTRQKLSRGELSDCLDDRRRRQILRLLRDQSGSVTERELAEQLIVDGGDRSIDDVPEATIEGVWIQLQHFHLPRLDDAGLLDWSESDETVAPTDSPLWEDPEFLRLIEMDDEDWDALDDDTTAGHLREVLTALESGGRVRRDVLARKIAAREADGESWAEAVDAVRTELHHVHLPRLEGAGLVEYDADDGTVTYQDLPASEGWER